MRYSRRTRHYLFAVTLLLVAAASLLQIQVVEGDGGVHAPGSRIARPLTVQVTDDMGRPVERASVTFHLPSTGPGGVFSNGLPTEVAFTDAAGRASIRHVEWNHSPGRFYIRIVASQEHVRAGIVSYQYITDAGGRAPAPVTAAKRGRSKWLLVVTVIALGASVGVVNGSRSRNTAPAASPPPVVSIGAPNVTVGNP